MARPNSTPDLNTVGGRIKWMRLQLHLTQEGLARRINVHQSTVAHWESNDSVPDDESVEALCELYECKRRMLLGEEAA